MRILLFVLQLLLCSALPLRAETVPGRFEIPNSEVHTIHSEILGRTYQLYIKTPPGYRELENSKKTYPVIYLNDGPYTFQVASGVTRLPAYTGVFENVIIVGFSFAQGEPRRASRVRDYTPSVDENWALQTGGAADYLQFLKLEALPFVEDRFRADSKRRVLVGQSLGGLFGAWVLLTDPELFYAYILTSPSLWYDQKLIFKLEDAYASNHDDLSAIVYLGTGEYETSQGETKVDMTGDHVAFAEQLKASDYPGLKLRDEIIPNGLHQTTFPVGFTRAMQWLFHERKE